jgi:hypothetical protein
MSHKPDDEIVQERVSLDASPQTSTRRIGAAIARCGHTTSGSARAEAVQQVLKRAVRPQVRDKLCSTQIPIQKRVALEIDVLSPTPHVGASEVRPEQGRNDSSAGAMKSVGGRAVRLRADSPTETN